MIAPGIGQIMTKAIQMFKRYPIVSTSLNRQELRADSFNGFTVALDLLAGKLCRVILNSEIAFLG